MNWNEKSLEAGEGRFIKGNEHIITADDQVREEIHVHAFSSGAKWQRDQLRTDEAIERVAAALFGEETELDWEYAAQWVRDDYGLFARRAITALLGEDT